MKIDELKLIYNLFKRIQYTEQNSGPRDIEIDRQIQNFIQKQPAAPYYMAQSILIQEAALTQLHQQIKNLKNEIEYLKEIIQKQSTKDSFLKKLFNMINKKKINSIYESSYNLQESVGNERNIMYPYHYGKNNVGFLSGALQTAVSIASGVVLGNILTNMFYQSSTQDIANIIKHSNKNIEDDIDSISHNNSIKDNVNTFHNIYENNLIDQDNSEYVEYTNNDIYYDNNESTINFSSDDSFI